MTTESVFLPDKKMHIFHICKQRFINIPPSCFGIHKILACTLEKLTKPLPNYLFHMFFRSTFHLLETLYSKSAFKPWYLNDRRYRQEIGQRFKGNNL